MKRDFLAVHFDRFEELCFEQISVVQLAGYQAWQLVKYPLYANLERKMQGGTSAEILEKAVHRKRDSILAKALRAFWSMVSVVRKARSQRGAGILVVTSANNKIYRDENGHFVNFVTDDFILGLEDIPFIYTEKTLDGDPKSPGLIRTDFVLDNLNPLLGFWVRYYSRSRAIKQVAASLKAVMKLYFPANGIEIPDAVINQSLVFYMAELKTYSFFLRWFPSGLLLTSEKPGTGMLAAANKRGFVSIDLQHGIIDKHHPLYTYSAKLKSFRNQMVLPNYIGVFGRFHKNIICGNGFWKDNEIVVLGGSRVEKTRRKYAALNISGEINKAYILVPTQWPVFSEMIELLESLIKWKIQQPILLKIHPLEPADNIDAFRRLSAASGGKVVIAEPGADIYKLIVESSLILGFDSAVLLEAITLSKPCITITTEKTPNGIHGMFDNNDLMDAIVPVSQKDSETLSGLLKRIANDVVFYREWSSKAQKLGLDLYENNYLENCRNFTHSVVAHG